MREIVFLNLESIFFPVRSTKKRLGRKDHLYESILIAWPAFFIYAVFEVSFNILKVNASTLDLLSIIFVIFSLLFFPVYIWIYSQANFMVLRIFLPGSFNDSEIDAIIGNMVSTNLFYVLPLIGPVISFISSKIILFSCLRPKLSIWRAINTCLWTIPFCSFFWQ